MNSIQRQNDMTLENEYPRLVGIQYAAGKRQETAPERMKRMSKRGNDAQLWMCLVVKVKSDAVRKDCIGTWNVRSTHQDKFEVVKQGMARVNINILGIIEEEEGKEV